MFRKILLLSTAVILIAALTGCHTETMEGFGRDVQKVGEKIEN